MLDRSWSVIHDRRPRGRSCDRAADARLNAAYRKALAGAESEELPVAVTRTRTRICDAQRAWLRYRDAFLALAKIKFPTLSPDRLVASQPRRLADGSGARLVRCAWRRCRRTGRAFAVGGDRRRSGLARVGIRRRAHRPREQSLRRLQLARDARDVARFEQDRRFARGELDRLGDILLRARQIVLAPRQGGGEIPGERIGGDQLQALVDVDAGADKITRLHGGTGTIEMHLAAQLGGKGRAGERRVQRLARIDALAGGEPGVAGLRPEIRAAQILGRFGLACRGLHRRGGGIPASGGRIGQAEAGPGIEAAALDPPLVGCGDRSLGRLLDQGGAFGRGLEGRGSGCGLHGGGESEQDGSHGLSRRVATVAISKAMSSGRDRR
ncbi:DUF1311 domain-containing protein [Sphingosinicella sp. BN140058]|nr:DUF1311 domain-containing protein [Sphingosinicella sp. BN140058]